MERRLFRGLAVLCLTVWSFLPVPISSAGVTVPFRPQGGFDFTETLKMVLNSAESYLRLHGAMGADGTPLSVWGRGEKEALDYLERIAPESAETPDLLAAAALISLPSSRQKAKSLFEQSVRASKSFAVGHCFLAYLSLLEDDWSGYGKHFGDAIKADPTYVPAYNSLALYYVHIGKREAALNLLGSGSARFPDEASFFYNQAFIYAHEHRWEEAQMSLENAVARQPTEQNRLMLGTILIQSRQYEGAQAVFESMLESNPKNALALAGLAVSYKERHNFAKAISLVEQALAIDPQNEEIRSELREHKEAYEKWRNQERDSVAPR